MTDSPKDLISSLMYIKDRPATITDFSLENVKWDVHYHPHHLLSLREYHQQLHWENLVQGMVTNQVIPCIGYITRIMDETGLSEELLEKYLFAGMEIQSYLEIALMSDEEREDFFAFSEEAHNEIVDTSDPDGLGAMIAHGIIQLRNQQAETEALENLWKESK